MTGKVPTVPNTTEETPPAASSPATPDSDQAASTDALPESASEPTYKAKTAKRIQELLDRATKAEARALELEARSQQTPTQPPATHPAASSPAPADDPEPNPDDPATYPDGHFDRKYLKDQARWEARQELRAERDRLADTDRQQRQHAEAERVHERFRERVEAARKDYADFDQVALSARTPIPKGSLIEGWVFEHPHGPRVLYHLHQHPAEVSRIAALPLFEQAEQLVLLGQHLAPGSTAVLPSTTAPPPPQTLPTRPSSSDPVERALAADDTGAYIREMNKRELAARRR